MRARVPVVVKITLQSPTQRSLIPHDEVVQAPSPDGAHEAFDVRILPWGSRRSNHFFDPHTGGDGRKVFSVDRLSIAQQVFRRLIPGERFANLPRCPLLARAVRSDRSAPLGAE